MTAARRMLGGWVIDALVAALCVTIDVTELARQAQDSPSGLRTALAVVAAGSTVVLLVRRRWPAAVLAVVLAAGAVIAAAGFAPTAHGPAVIVALYTVAAETDRRTGLVGAGATVAAVTVHQLATWWVDGSTFVGNLALLAGAWWMGDAARRRRAEAAAHAERAALLAAAREELAVHAVAEERLRIARELHDVVAHTMSAIAVQAGTGRVAFEREPAVARASLAQIESLARDGLGELRRLLGVLRTVGGADADRAPVASLADLHRLVATARSAGVAVALRVEGEPRPLAAGVDLAAYRIVQEALTNIARHARADRAEVTVTHGDDAIVIQVDDDGAAPGPGPGTAPGPGPGPGAPSGPGHGPGSGAPSGSGVGLVGMRERAAACGGTLHAGPRPEGGFRVVAWLPRHQPVRDAAPDAVARR